MESTNDKKPRIRYVAEPHIRSHKIKGKLYYYYCHGTDREIYLGTADAILQAKIATGKKPSALFPDE